MSSDKWKNFPKGMITAEMAEAEPEAQRLFSRPAPRPSIEVVRMLKIADDRQKRRAA
mgnify:CR=1 FL=1